MKIAYRIVTPIMAAASLVLAFVLKMFSFSIGIIDTGESTSAYLDKISAYLSQSKFGSYSFSIIDIIKRLVTALTGSSESGESAVNVTELFKPMLTPTIVFLVFLVLSMLITISILFVSALSDKKLPVFVLCGVGLAFMLTAIVASNSAFAILMNPEKMPLADIVSAFSTSSLITLAAAFVKIESATLSGAFFAMFGIFILLIVWTIFTNYLIKNPLQIAKKQYKRKKPMRRIRLGVAKTNKKSKVESPAEGIGE